MPHESAPPSKPVACPICGRRLKWTPDRWLAAFECERCGGFSDFGGTAPPSDRRPPSPQLSLPYESARAASQDDEPDEENQDKSGGTAA